MSSNLKIQKICENCGNEYTAKTLVTKYCSHSCNRKHYKKLKKEEKLKEYFVKEVSKKEKVVPPHIATKDYLSVLDSAVLIGASRRTIERLISSGKLKATKIGTRTIIKKSEIERLFK